MHREKTVGEEEEKVVVGRGAARERCAPGRRKEKKADNHRKLH